MSKVTSLQDYRAKKGLEPARPPVPERPLVERVLARYQKFSALPNAKIPPTTAFRMLSIRCAKRIVKRIEAAGMQVDELARFQFFGTGEAGTEALQVRLNRLMLADGNTVPRIFSMDPLTLEPELIPTYRDGRLKPLLTLPMSPFYRLN